MLSILLIVAPYVAAATFLAGFAWRLRRWAATPVPFPIATTAGQQASLRFLRPGRLESPSSGLGVIGRVALEVLLFRSLFRNTGRERHAGVRLAFPERKALWAAALAFHWSLLVILVRHLRLVLEPVPPVITGLSAVDGFFRVGTPGWYISDAVVVVALAWLLARRLRDPLLRYLTLPGDVFALGLLLAVVGSGVAMRHWAHPDLVAVKQFALGLVSFHPAALPTLAPATLPGSLGYGPAAVTGPMGEGASTASSWFAVHLLLASALVAVFPFTKLMHAAGALLSPTRALRADSRRTRHLNPWNAPVSVHTYAEWEEEFHDKIVAAGLPLDRDLQNRLGTEN